MIGVLGINHKTASQDVRQLFSFARGEIIYFSELVRRKTEISEIVVLSTCHRTELYYYDNTFNRKIAKVLTGLLHDFKKVSGNHEEHFYKYSGVAAVKHLFRVTSGMDSVVIGEDQIVKQVKDAYMFCTEAVLTEAVLMRLFQKCFETSKRVRTETTLQQGPTSLSKVAVDLCCRVFDDLSDRTVLFIGSGETGRLALHYMFKLGVTKTYVSNRTYDNALALARDYGATALDFNKFRDILPECDIVIVATGAQEHFISKSDVEKAQDERDHSRQLYIDLSVPRNIETSISAIKNIQLHGVDDMQRIFDEVSVKRTSGIEHATSIINEMAEEYMHWYDCLSLSPIIKTITKNMQKVRDKEMNAYKKTEDIQNFQVIDEYTNRITQKYIRMLIRNLRNASKDKPSAHSMNIVNKLFKFE